MKEKSRVRLGLEQLESRDAPALISVIAPFVNVSVNVPGLRRFHHRHPHVVVRAPFTTVNVGAGFVGVRVF